MRIMLLPGVTVLALLSLHQDAEGQPTVKEDPAHAAARKRQEAIKTVKVRFRREDEYRRGSASGFGGPRLSGTKVLPAEDTRAESENTVLLDGKQFRYEDNHPVFHLPEGELRPQSRIGVANTELAKSLVVFQNEQPARPIGRITGTALAEESKFVEVQPILMFCRGVEPSLPAYPIPRFRPTGGRAMIDGKECLAYEFGGQQHLVACWVDPAAGYCIRRKQSRTRGELSTQTDVAYSPHSELGLVPDRWTFTRFMREGKVAHAISVNVLEWEAPGSIPASQFDIAFPPATRYADFRTGKEYEVRPDGSRWEIDPTGQAPPIEAPAEGWFARYRWHLLAGCLLAAVVFYLIGRRFRQNRAY